MFEIKRNSICILCVLLPFPSFLSRTLFVTSACFCLEQCFFCFLFMIRIVSDCVRYTNSFVSREINGLNKWVYVSSLSFFPFYWYLLQSRTLAGGSVFCFHTARFATGFCVTPSLCYVHALSMFQLINRTTKQFIVLSILLLSLNRLFDIGVVYDI